MTSTCCSPASPQETRPAPRRRKCLDHLRRSAGELGQTVVRVTHDRDAATCADDVVTMNDGRIA